jgi:hypothetical protein
MNNSPMACFFSKLLQKDNEQNFVRKDKREKDH